jgi:predicted secreted protein
LHWQKREKRKEEKNSLLDLHKEPYRETERTAAEEKKFFHKKTLVVATSSHSKCTTRALKQFFFVLR